MNVEVAILGDIPRWGAMWLLAGGLFFVGKAAMLHVSPLHGWRKLAFLLGWAGMDPRPFMKGAKAQGKQALPWMGPLVNILFGAVLLWGVARYVAHPLAAGWIGMTGLIFLLHFGIFGLLAVLWNAVGVPVVPIMRCPMAATSLAEFWGRRWNLAFRDISYRVFFKPLAYRAGKGAAMWVTFAMSGLVHELVVSVPAGAGYGGPTLYFLLQGAGMMLEKRGGTKARWLRTHAFTALPACILFHPPFVERVMIPFFRFLGALP